jgi:hypothetical protein
MEVQRALDFGASDSRPVGGSRFLEKRVLLIFVSESIQALQQRRIGTNTHLKYHCTVDDSRRVWEIIRSQSLKQ